MKIKIVTGFRKDQTFSVDVSEAHKAYYLFFNPDSRTVFRNGVAVKGSEITRIEPDYQGSMGWNPTYPLGDDDWNEIRDKGVDRKLREVMATAQEVSRICNEIELNSPLIDVVTKYPQLAYPKEEVKQIGNA